MRRQNFWIAALRSQWPTPSLRGCGSPVPV